MAATTSAKAGDQPRSTRAASAGRVQVPLQVGRDQPARLAAGAASLASAAAQSPPSKATISSTESRCGRAEPVGRQFSHTAPPAATLNAVCGPGAEHLAHSVRAAPSRHWTWPGSGTRRGRARTGAPARPAPAARPRSAGTGAAPARPPRSAARPSRRSPTRPSSARSRWPAARRRPERLGLGDQVEAALAARRLLPSGSRLCSWTSMWLPGSRRAPNFDVVRRTPLPTARTRPCRRVSSVTIRSASPSFCTRRTTASSR